MLFALLFFFFTKLSSCLLKYGCLPPCQQMYAWMMRLAVEWDPRGAPPVSTEEQGGLGRASPGSPSLPAEGCRVLGVTLPSHFKFSNNLHFVWAPGCRGPVTCGLVVPGSSALGSLDLAGMLLVSPEPLRPPHCCLSCSGVAYASC